MEKDLTLLLCFHCRKLLVLVQRHSFVIQRGHEYTASVGAWLLVWSLCIFQVKIAVRVLVPVALNTEVSICLLIPIYSLLLMKV